MHTPGPWTHVRNYGDNSGPINGPDGKAVAAIVASSRRPADEKAANARLIAAAPDLLHELQNALQALEAHGFTQQAGSARAAIAKAEGK